MQKPIFRVGFEPTTLVLERVKTVHALHCSPTVIGEFWKHSLELRLDVEKLTKLANVT
jgi:hypothetical protein